MQYLSLTALVLLTLSGCIFTDHLYLGNQRCPPRQTNAPVDFLTDPPSRPFIKLAMVEARGRSEHTDWEELREALGKEAGKVGADAVMDLSMGGTSFGVVAGGNRFVGGGSGERKKLTGLAIRYQETCPQ